MHSIISCCFDPLSASREGVELKINDEFVASTDYNGRSPYGAPWLQLVAISSKRGASENGRNKPKPLP
jgi:hypothetical protein